MRGFIKAAPCGLLIAGGLALAPSLVVAQAQAQARTPAQAQPVTPGAIVPAADAAAIGRDVLNAGPDPRVQLDGLSRDHAAIFGTQDEDEQAVLDQERALRAQQDQMRMLERLLTQKPAAANAPAAATIPLNSGTSMNMAPLAPATSGSQLGSGDAQRSVEQMQKRVDELRRGADTLRQGVR